MGMQLKSAILLACLAIGSQTQADEKFLPPTFVGSKMIACGVGGGHDGYADVFAMVQYEDHEWNVTIAKRGSAWEGLQDCVAWIKNLKGPLYDAAAKSK